MNCYQFQRYIEHNCFETREKWKELSKDPIFIPIYDTNIHEEKELALQRLKKIIQYKVFSVFDFVKNPLNVFANHEM